MTYYEPEFEPIIPPVDEVYEPEYEELVEHDTVMMMIDGELREVTADDFEAEQRV